MSLTTRKREAYIWVEKRVTNLGGLYLGELIHRGGGGGGQHQKLKITVPKGQCG